MPTSGYLNLICLFVRLSLRRGPTVYMNVWCGNIVLLTTKFSDVAKLTTLTPLSLLISCKPSFTIVGLKLSSLSTFALKPSNKFSYCTCETDQITRKFLVEVVLYNIALILTFITIILHQRPLNIIYDILSLTNFTVLTADMIRLCTIKNVPNWWCSFLSHNRTSLDPLNIPYASLLLSSVPVP
jgi:hypothetical protein